MVIPADLNGFGKEIEYVIPPDKERDENMPKRNIITVYNGDKGWQLDRGGVSPASMTEVAVYTEYVKKDMDNFLRHRIHEQNMIFRYAGIDIVDYNEAEWVEFVDADNRTFQLAVATGTNLPVRWVVDTRDANTRSRSEETTYYSNYHPIPGNPDCFSDHHRAKRDQDAAGFLGQDRLQHGSFSGSFHEGIAGRAVGEDRAEEKEGR